MDSTTALILAQATSGRMTHEQLMQTGFFPPTDGSAAETPMPTLASRQRRAAMVEAEVQRSLATGGPLSPASALADLRRSGVLQQSPVATAAAGATPHPSPLSLGLRPPPPTQPQSASVVAPTPASAAASPHIVLGSSGRQLQLQSSDELLSSLFDDYRARHQSAASAATLPSASPPAAASARTSPGTQSSSPASHHPKRLHFAPHTTSPLPAPNSTGGVIAGGRGHSSPLREHYSLQLAPMDSSAAATAAAASSTAFHAGTPAMPAYAYSFTPARAAAPAGTGLPLSSPLHLAATPWTSVFLSRLADEDQGTTGAASAPRPARGSSASPESPLPSQGDPDATQEQLVAQVNALVQEMEALKAFALHAQEQHVHATHAQTTQHQQALQSLQQSHALELQQLSAHSDALQAAREQQAQALEDARTHAASRAQQVMEEKQQSDRVALEQFREQLARDTAAREHELKMLERNLRQKESDLDEVLSRAQRLCQDKEDELARQAQEAQAALDQRAREQEHQLQRGFADRERSLLDQVSQARAAESRALSELDARRQQLEREWSQTERERLAALAERETALADEVAAKLASVERERQHVLDGVRQQQALIDAGNESKLRAILHQYKTRVAHLESELRQAREAQLRAQDGVILQGERARAKLAGCDAVLAEYKTLVGEQAAQLEMLQTSHRALEAELAGVRGAYEELIGKIAEAEAIKARTLVTEELRSRDMEIGQMRRAQQELLGQLERLRAGSAEADGAALRAHEEAERLRTENRRLVAEQERMQVMLYGHRGHARTSSASSATGAARAGTAAGKKSVKKSGLPLPPPALSPATSSLRPSSAAAAAAAPSSRSGAQGKLTVASLHGSTASQVDFSDALAHGSRP